MASYYDSLEEGARGVGTVGLVRIAGAVSSAALVIGLGVWGYNIAVRDVMGIPVVRALEGAMRVAPASPGGTVTDHQGLAVNDVAALGVATPLPDSLTLAPRPVDLTEDDLAGLEGDAGLELLTASAGLEDPATLLVPAADSVPAPATGGRAPMSPVEVDVAAPGPVPEDAILAAVTEAVADPVAVTPAIRPLRRPAGLAAIAPETAVQAAPVAAVISATQDVSATATATVEVDPATLAVGTPLVQLGAFDSAEDARAAWGQTVAVFAELGAHGMVIQAATSGGQTFYRLRAADFASDDAARKFCTDVVAKGATCIPVAHR